MQFSLSTIAAVAALISTASAHLTMQTPAQWNVQGEPQSPLAEDGSNFPCQGAAPVQTAAAEYTPGGKGSLVIQGSAVHGGGSGQMLITYDFPPTKDSVWRVMTSWMGDHPVKAEGNFPADATRLNPAIPFSIPKDLPAGRAVVAWSWFNRSGNREHYMKCSTVNIKGSNKSKAGFEALPTMFRANSGNGCTVPEGVNAIAFKNPGPEALKQGGYTPTPVACDSSKPGSAGGSSGGSSTPSKDTTDTAEPAEPKTPAAPKTPTEPKAPAATKPATKPAETKAPATTKPAAGGACVEGAVTCNADGTWSLCGSGQLQAMGPVTPGMQCKNGSFSAKGAKRSVRFSPEHMRRRH